MDNTKLYPILFEADETMDLDIGKDVSAAVTTALEPVTKDVEQMKKDVQVIQKTAGQRKEEPTRARSTSGATQTSSATTATKGSGIISPSGGGGGSANNDLKKDMETIKSQVSTLTNMAKQVQG
jgi:hypothetical protein